MQRDRILPIQQLVRLIAGAIYAGEMSLWHGERTFRYFASPRRLCAPDIAKRSNWSTDLRGLIRSRCRWFGGLTILMKLLGWVRIFRAGCSCYGNDVWTCKIRNWVSWLAGHGRY